MLLGGTGVPLSVADTVQIVGVGNVAAGQSTNSTGVGAVTVADPDPETVPMLPSTVADTFT